MAAILGKVHHAMVDGIAAVELGALLFDLAPDAARLEQVTPLSANPSEHPDYVNGGVYRWHIDIVGVGFSYMFDKPKPIDAVEEKKTPEPKPPAKKPTEEKKESGKGTTAPPAVATFAVDGDEARLGSL